MQMFADEPAQQHRCHGRRHHRSEHGVRRLAFLTKHVVLTSDVGTHHFGGEFRVKLRADRVLSVTDQVVGIALGASERDGA